MRCKWITFDYPRPWRYCGQPATFETSTGSPLCDEHAYKARVDGWLGIQRLVSRETHRHDPTSVTQVGGGTLWFCADCGLPMTITEVRYLDGDR